MLRASQAHGLREKYGIASKVAEVPARYITSSVAFPYRNRNSGYATENVI